MKNNLFPFKKHVQYQFHNLVRPDSTSEVNRKIGDECMEANEFEYSPSIDYKNIDYQGRYVNVMGYERKSVPERFINPNYDLPPLVVRFMGGSTMFGLNCTDAETIPSAFVNEYRKRYPNGRSIKVINNGVCGYHSFNELGLFSHLNFIGERTDIVIFFDGLNDLVMTRAVYKREPYFYYRLKLASRKKSISAKEISRIVDSTYLHYETPKELVGKNIPDSLLKRYLDNIQNVRKEALLNNSQTYFIIQPNPFFKYTNRKNDPICMQDEKPILMEAYQKLARLADSTKDLIFLGNMLENEKGYPFVDLVHYSPYMNKKIAISIVDSIAPIINKNIDLLK